MVGVEKEVGEAWDGLDVAGKKALMDGGARADQALGRRRTPSSARSAPRWPRRRLKELDGKGLPATRDLHQMKSLADKHAKTSKNFWN